MNSKRKILIVSGFFPYPTYHGGMVDVWQRIIGLKELGFTIDLLYTSKFVVEQEHIDIVSEYINCFYKVDRKNRAIDFFNFSPLQVISRNNLQNVSINKSYDYLILEGDYVGSVVHNYTIKANKLIVRSHNDESHYFKNLSKSSKSLLRKVFYTTESYKFKRYTKKIYDKADKIWFISKKEESIFKTGNSSTKSIHLPVPFSISDIKRPVLKSKSVLFVGSLFMDNNMEGILWYLNTIHAKICKEVNEYKLIIAGSLGEKKEQELRKVFDAYTNIDLHFNCSNLLELYAGATVFINPMLHGAGVKIKSVNAIVNGLPLVSTNVGVEGIGLTPRKEFLLGDTAADFREAVIMLLLYPEKGHSLVQYAQQYLKENHYLEILKNELCT
ncbi:glycosyltransferase family 4 protein [Tenacibaculum sp. SG-28]|uniref:glycosyltransferase family 4 protein n=1 Tax=Tenacibaculum sp. SG-28 TaxID=754426 RepID=UPI000CF5707F|nr:glycosyltransferase family 4 protein [Tenacibaculum sp. SG-28]PQJ21876.1 hypothetical protein BSU00_07485 [Tenacibaculum sp. SG-28]